MASVYVHLSGKDVDSALLQAYGMQDQIQDKVITNLMPKPCTRCRSQNESSNKFCKLCGMILDEDERTRIQAQQSEKEDIAKVMDILMRKPEFMQTLIQKMKEIQL